MRKTAIFVEGQTELIFVREYLLKTFNFLVDVECRTLFSDGSFQSAEYDFHNPDADIHFQIINVGGDVPVIGRMLKLERYLWNSGYSRIICLRDMYSKAYRDLSKKIDTGIINLFIEGAEKTISTAQKPSLIGFVFAIMEIESWFLSHLPIFLHLNPILTAKYIQQGIGRNIETEDPEKTVFHPADMMNQIYQLVGLNYDKHKKDIEVIAAQFSQKDFETLYNSPKCNSFNQFFDLIQKSVA